MGKNEADANAQREARRGSEGIAVLPSDENVGRLHEEVESALRKLDSTVAELDRRQTWRNILTTMRRGPWILGAAGLLVAGLLLRRKGREIRKSTPSSAGRAVAAGSFGLLALLAKRWAKRLWAGQA